VFAEHLRAGERVEIGDQFATAGFLRRDHQPRELSGLRVLQPGADGVCVARHRSNLPLTSLRFYQLGEGVEAVRGAADDLGLQLLGL